MSNEDKVSFGDLNLKMGQIIQIHPSLGGTNERFDCLLVGCIPGEAVIVSAAPGAGVFPKVVEGQRVVIRVMSANGVALFPTTVLFISDVPTLMVFLDFPQAIKFKLVRNASRVDVALPVLVSSLSERTKNNIPGKILDISIGGAKALLDVDIGKVGEEISIKGKFKVGNIQRIVELSSTIRRKSPGKDQGWVYGVEFREAEEEKLLVLFGYIFNSMALGRVQIVS